MIRILKRKIELLSSFKDPEKKKGAVKQSYDKDPEKKERTVN